jgi:hypothetical protein
MNPIVGYVLVGLALCNLIGLLLVFRRLGRAAVSPVAAPVTETAPAPPVATEPAIAPEALNTMLRRLENRLGDIEEQVRHAPTVTLASEPGSTSDRSLALAQRLARQGATPKDIAETCGISITEAELLHRLHAAR